MTQMELFSNGASPPPVFRHERILASAGSGKTHRLTDRYLQLVFAGAEAHTILASTFTRLAAGEIRDRILGRLARAADDDEQRARLAAAALRPSLTRVEVLAHLRPLTQQLHVMQVRTLDSFFASIVRGFALELGIPPGCAIMEENEARALRERAMQRMLDDEPHDRLVELLRLLTQGQSDRSIMFTLDRTITDLYEIFLESDAAAWATVPPVAGELGADALAAALAALEAAAPDTNRTFVTAHEKACLEARERRWDDFIDGGIAEKVLLGETTYARVKIPPEIRAAYEPVLRHAIAVLVRRLRDQTIASRRLLELYDARYRQIKQERHVLTFDDLRTTLDRAEAFAPLGLVNYRIDATLNHVLLDEFQDTSVPQWRVLEPIVRELVADETTGRTFFCVGDVKQSIYGWRGAEPEVLDRLPTLLFGAGGEGAMRDETMARSWRSAPPIIDVVNEVFGAIDENAAMATYPAAAAAWARVFRTHTTEHTALPGYVELRTGPELLPGRDSRRANERRRLQDAADLVAEVHARAPGQSIGILTRTNEGVSRLLYELGPAQRDLPVSGRGGGPLTDAPAVNAILDLLELADHPDDTIAAFNVAASPLGAAVGAGDLVADKTLRVELSRRVRRSLAQRGYAETIAEWTAAIAPACDQRELRRVVQLLELAAGADDRPPPRTADFVRLVETREMADTFPAPIQVMTIHQAKGLQYDTVVLPELDVKLSGHEPVVVFERERLTGPVTRVCRSMKEELRAALPPETGIASMFDDHKMRTVRESLCLLYVAMTRAKQGLYMVINPARQSEKEMPKTMAGVLRAALADFAAPKTVLHAHGDADALAAGPVPARPVRPTPAAVDRISLPAPQRDLPRGQPAPPASDHREGRRLRERMQVPDRDARDHGSAIHAMFEQIEWLDDCPIDDTVLADAAQHAAPGRDRRWIDEQVRDFRRILDRPAVRATLERAGEADEVYRELPYVLRRDDGSMQQGSIDRVIVTRRGGKPAGATIIDFKTDDVAAKDVPAKAEHYRRQLESYRAAVARMFGIDHQHVRMRLVFVRPGVTRDLETREHS